MPSVPPAAINPAARRAEYPRFRISGMPEEPIAEHVAGDEPHMAANTEQASVFARPRPPGTLYSQLLSELYRSEPARDFPIAAPIRTNSGMVRRVKLFSSE